MCIVEMLFPVHISNKMNKIGYALKELLLISSDIYLKCGENCAIYEEKKMPERLIHCRDRMREAYLHTPQTVKRRLKAKAVGHLPNHV